MFSNFDRLGRPGTVTEGTSTTTLAYDTLTGETSTIYPAGHGVLPNLSLVMKAPSSGRPGGYTLNTTLQDVTYDYDTSGRFGGLTSGGHGVAYQYYPGTAILRETTHTVTGGGTPRIETRHVDLVGRTTGVVTTVPDGAGRRTAASTGYMHDERGLRKRLTREDGSTWTFGYNDRAEVTSGLKKLVNGELAAGLQFSYQYDGIGNRQWAKSGGDSSGQNQRTFHYTPNALNQYSEITTPGSFDILVRSQDPVGVTVNGSSLAVNAQGYFHRAEATTANTNGAWAALDITSPVGQNTISGHRWLPPATYSPVHDDDGNLTNDGRWTYTWDAENRLISMITNSSFGFPPEVPKLKLEFAYDFQSRRIQKKVTNLATSDVMSDEHFLYNGWNPVALFDASGATLTLKQTCLWGLDLSTTLQGAGGVGGLLLITDHSVPITTHFPSYDGNGNIIAWTAANGDILQRIDYDPFGNVATREGVTGFEAPAWGFSTKYQDKETGLLYYGFRFYDPVTGKWPSRDPIGENGGVNLYGFLNNSGINKIDVSGMTPMNEKSRYLNELGGALFQYRTSHIAKLMNIDGLNGLLMAASKLSSVYYEITPGLTGGQYNSWTNSITIYDSDEPILVHEAVHSYQANFLKHLSQNNRNKEGEAYAVQYAFQIMRNLVNLENRLIMHGGMLDSEVKQELNKSWNSAWADPGPTIQSWEVSWASDYIGSFGRNLKGNVSTLDILSAKSDFGGFGLKGMEIQEYFNQIPLLKRNCIKVSIFSELELRAMDQSKIEGWNVIPISYSDSLSSPLR